MKSARARERSSAHWGVVCSQRERVCAASTSVQNTYTVAPGGVGRKREIAWRWVGVPAEGPSPGEALGPHVKIVS